MNNQELAVKILELVGGKQNVVSAANCMTRLRIQLVDRSLVKVNELKNTEGVQGVLDDEVLQVVLGPGKAKRVTDIFVASLGGYTANTVIENWQTNKAQQKLGQKQGGVKGMLRTIADIFIPLLPAIIAAGLFIGFASLMGQLPFAQDNIAAQSGFWYILQVIFSLIGGSFLGYFAIYTGYSAAQKFGATPALGGMLGMMSIMEQIVSISTMLGLYNADVPLESVLTTGKGGIIGVIFGVWILAKVEKFVRKHIPEVLDLILTPVISLLSVAVVYVLLIMPAAGFISDWIVKGLTLLVNSGNPVVSVISGYVLSALFLPLVLLGLHHGLVPIYAVQLESMGGVSLFPVLAMAGAGQVGAAIAIYIKSRQTGNLSLRKVITGALPAGFLGVGEPLIYGVTLPMGKPFITAGLGAGFGGAFCMLMGVQSVAWGPSGLVAIPLMKTPSLMLYYFLGLVISYIAGFIITWFVIKEKEVANVGKQNQAQEEQKHAVEEKEAIGATNA